MATVGQLLKEKGNHVWTIAPGATVFEALEIMAKHEIGSLLVMENDDVVGIFSERDYARKVILQGKHSKNIPVSEIMTAKVVCVEQHQTVNKCMLVMTDKRIRHLPVISDGKLAGVISIGDVVKSVIAEQEMMINHLSDYIYG